MITIFNNDFEILISIILISIFTIFCYSKLRKHGKIYLNIFKMKINIINKNSNWNEINKEISENTKYIELDFILQIYNNSNSNNNIYNLDIYKKKKNKFILVENHNLNLADSMKTITGSTTYEKIKFINLMPYEVKEYRIKVKLTKEEYKALIKEPIYLKYKNKRKSKKLKLNKFLNKNELH